MITKLEFTCKDCSTSFSLESKLHCACSEKISTTKIGCEWFSQSSASEIKHLREELIKARNAIQPLRFDL